MHACMHICTFPLPCLALMPTAHGLARCCTALHPPHKHITQHSTHHSSTAPRCPSAVSLHPLPTASPLIAPTALHFTASPLSAPALHHRAASPLPPSLPAPSRRSLAPSFVRSLARSFVPALPCL
ncbi:hypothetical protein PMIN03_008158 [Paraphaeosphaeria minitans]